MMSKPVYITAEGRQFGLETRAKVRRQLKTTREGMDPIMHELNVPVFMCGGLRCQVWAWWHGCGWLKVEHI